MNKTIIIALSAIVLVGGTGAVVYFERAPSSVNYNYVSAKKGDLSEEVDVTGDVKPAQNVDLAFEKSGKVAYVKVNTGDKVIAGETLAALDDSDTAAQLSQAEAAVQSAEAQSQSAKTAYALEQTKLDALKKGTRPEELDIAQTKYDNAERAVTDANQNLDNVKAKAQTDLNNIYSHTNDILNDAYAKTFGAVSGLDGIFSNNMSDAPKLNLTFSVPQTQIDIENYRPKVNMDLTAIKNEINGLNSDQNATDAALSDITAKLSDIQNFFTELNTAMNYITSVDPNNATYQANVSAGLTAINGAITEVNSQIQAIAAQKSVNNNLISAAQTGVNTAENSLALAQSDLNLEKAGATADDIKSQEDLVSQAQAAEAAAEASVAQAEANVQNLDAQEAKTAIVSPMDGVITREDAKAGEIVAMNAPLISIISNKKFQIETQIPESDLQEVKIGEEAKVTLDAYGNGKIFGAKVISIDPGVTMINGSPTYKATLEFDNEDGLIKDGLTANINIVSQEKKDVIIIPSLSVLKNGNGSFVIVDNGTPKGEERQIQTGLTNNDRVEVVSGLNEGDRIAYFGN